MREQAGMRRALARLALPVVITLVLAACSSDATPSPSSPAALTPIPTAVATPDPAVSPAASPTPTPTAKPTPAAWTSPSLVSSAEYCSSLRVGIDSAGRSHAAAACGDGVLYAVTKADGSWAKTQFPLPENRVERDPQLAFQGNLAYLGYSRLAIGEGGCGDDGLSDIGVFYRKRTQPSGSWSDPVRMGRSDDHLVQFRVNGTTLHAIVQNEGDGHSYYLLIKGTTSKRYLLPADAATLRIGNDGRARVAYSIRGSIRIATFTGSSFSGTNLAAVDARNPLLVLDSRGRAHLVWTRNSQPDEGGGCASPDETVDPNRGLYYATNASGTWRSERLTQDLGEVAFQVDGSTGQVNLVIAAANALTYYTKPPGGAWSHEKLPPRQATSPSIARDPATGRLLILYIDEGGSGIYAISKGG